MLKSKDGRLSTSNFPFRSEIDPLEGSIICNRMLLFSESLRNSAPPMIWRPTSRIITIIKADNMQSMTLAKRCLNQSLSTVSKYEFKTFPLNRSNTKAKKKSSTMVQLLPLYLKKKWVFMSGKKFQTLVLLICLLLWTSWTSSYPNGCGYNCKR